jgi:hypothetical protein
MFDLMAAVRAEQAGRAGGAAPLTRRPPEGPEAVRGAHPSDIVFVDVETYFDRDYSLNNSMLAQYLHDRRFKIHGVGVGFRGRRHWLTEDEFRRRAAKTPWGRLQVAAHNAQIDAAVLAWRFGVAPARWVDTLAMARGAYPQLPDYGLGTLAERFGLGRKLDTLAALAGVRDLTPAQWEELRRYNDNDLDLLERLYALLAPTYPPSELDLIDRTVLLCTEPCLVLDAGVLKDHGAETQRQRQTDLAAAGVPLEDLRSGDRFAGHLTALGVEVPRTVSSRTGTERFALSVKDPEFAALRDHPDERVRRLVQARLTAMSSIAVTRPPRMMALAALGPLAVELNYYGAATGRFSGGGGVNLQNLPRDSALRRAICAPEGHRLVGCDSAQIEARVLAWFAREERLLEAFRAGRDVYCEFASVFFGRPIGKADARERQVGKTAILGLGYGMGAKKFAANLRASGVDLAGKRSSASSARTARRTPRSPRPGARPRRPS